MDGGGDLFISLLGHIGILKARQLAGYVDILEALLLCKWRIAMTKDYNSWLHSASSNGVA